MADDKNLYHLMLELPEDMTSPDHYELLGLEHFEDDEGVIKEAAIDANEMLLAWQNSEYHRECDRLMDEVVKARAILLDAKRKAKYDERLRQRLGIEDIPGTSDREIGLAPVPPSRAELQRQAELRRRAEQREAEEAALKSKILMWGLTGVVAGVLVVGLAIVGVSSLLSSGDAQRSSGDSQTASPKPVTVVIARAASNPTNANSVAFHVAFSDSVKKVDFRDFQLNPSGITADSLKAEDVTEASDADSRTFRVIVRDVDGDGTLGLDVASDADIVDEAGNTVTLTSTESKGYTIDNTGPIVTLTHPENGAYYNDTTFPQEIRGTASEPGEVSSVSKVQVAIRQNATRKYWNGSNAFDGDTAVPSTAVGTESWSLPLTRELFSADGDYTIGVLALDTTGNRGEMVVATLTRDTFAPTAVSVESAAANPTRAAEIEYAVTFSEPVRGVDISDFSLTHDPDGSGSSVRSVSGGGSKYTVTVAIGVRDGTLRLDLRNESTIEDRAGNPLNGGFMTGAVVSVGPLSLTSPFDLQEAQKAQQSWAEHLGTEATLTNSIGMKMVLIPPGEFLMGSPESEKDRSSEELQHRVRITKPFYLGQTEVTQDQWESLTKTKPWSDLSGVKEGAQHAATCLRRWSAETFCQLLSEKESVEYRLPTEAEWEYACRAGTTTAYCFGDDASRLGEYAWFRDNAYSARTRSPHQVGLKKANAFGLYDMHGNVGEWCQDIYDMDYYANSPSSDPPGPGEKGDHGVIRGGSWGDPAKNCRSACRDVGTVFLRSATAGIRVVAVPPRRQVRATQRKRSR